MAEENVFLYTVNPRKVITGLSGCGAIRTAKSLFLTKEDVKLCLQKATVYRRFAAENIVERVNVGNIDRLHREKYVSEADWDKEVAKEMSKGHAKVDNIKPTADKIKESEQVVEPEKPEKVEELVVESDDEKEVLKESVPVEEEVATETAEVIEVGNSVEEVVDEEVQAEPEIKEDESEETTKSAEKENTQKFTYNKKKK